MTVGDAFDLIDKLRDEKVAHQNAIGDNIYHANYETHLFAIKKLNRKIEDLEELVYNQELDDSYDQNGLIK